MYEILYKPSKCQSSPSPAPLTTGELGRIRGLTTHNKVAASMNGRPWRKLERSEATAIWNRFYSTFEFRPSTKPQDWPGIREPEPSITWSIQAALADPDPLMIETHRTFNRALLEALQGFLPLQSAVLALDWQHPCYEFFPHDHEGSVRPDGYGAKPSPWRVPVLPDGDYSIFLAHDFSWGTFGHPWEGTLCVWGHPLVGLLSPFLDESLGTAVRRDGRAAV